MSCARSTAILSPCASTISGAALPRGHEAHDFDLRFIRSGIRFRSSHLLVPGQSLFALTPKRRATARSTAGVSAISFF
jgi:hypothetical protein